MPILANAKKALRKSKKRAAINRVVKSTVKTNFTKHSKAPTATSLKEAYSAIDKAVKKHVLHKNKAARLKSQVAKKMPAATK